MTGNEPIWGGSIALDLFLGGMGVGAYLYAVSVSFVNNGKYDRASRVGAYLTPVCVLLGLLFLVTHLGQPFKFPFVMLAVRLTSPIWWGAWLQTIFVGISLIYAWMWYSNRERLDFLPQFIGSRKAIGLLGVPFALAVGTYHGFVLMVFKSKPLWNSGPVTVSAILGFIMTGIALVILFLYLSGRNRELVKELRFSRNVLAGTIIVQIFTILLWISAMFFGGAGGQQAMTTLLTEFGVLFWGAIAVGLLLPLAIGTTALYKEKKTGEFSYSAPLLVSVLVLLGGYTFRYIIIIAGQA